MTYREIIKDNCYNHSDVSWWPRYAYHYTDIENATEILISGKLYSRNEAQRLDLMRNDNASEQVIEGTDKYVLDKARLYFRPKTPTQYHNEGFKHPDLRFNQNINANVLVPVFFLFDLEKLLKRKDVYFSEMSQAGYGSNLLQGIDDFANMNFERIYSSGSMIDASVDKQYRHAEIVVDNSLLIDSCIQKICCRNECEKISLMNLLRRKGVEKYNRYKDIIEVSKNNMFEYNGLYVEECQYYSGCCAIIFSNTREKKKYSCNRQRVLSNLEVLIELEWYIKGKLIDRQIFEKEVDYENAEMIQLKDIFPPYGARSLYICVRVMGKMMCLMSYDLYKSVVF